ncbi:MAG: hypothetical protein A2Y86_00570 [Candidatus Aminicenantes bacterium RBG_13_62_12]|nr:MAG: hypothetical protein A2Y86_00570 [Candidatus Aminicenantes bacterium RBG_13_62_12]
MKKRLALVVSLTAALVLSGCKEESLTVEAESTIPVKTVELQPKSIQEFVTATGTAYAVRDVSLKTEQAGRYILHTNTRAGRPFRMGDGVRRDELIISLENPEFVNQVAYDSKKLQKESAQREFTKQQSVYEKGGITLKELNDAERAFIDSKYNFENAVLSLKKLEIRAPFDGVIVDLPHYSDKKWVETNTVVAQNMDYSRLYTELTLPGKDMENVAPGQPVVVSDYSRSEKTQTGSVTQISPALDPESRMFKLQVEVPNAGLLIKPGSFIKADIVVRRKDAVLVIPKTVVLDRRGAKAVFVVERGIALERRIQTGIENADEIEVVSGLKAGDRMVTEGFETLRDRSRVKIIE